MSPLYDFRVQFTDADGIACEQALRIDVQSAGFFYDLVWGVPSAPIGTFEHDGFSINATGDFVDGCTGTRQYNGPSFNGTFEINATNITTAALDIFVRWGMGSPDFPLLFQHILAAGVYSFPFTVPNTAGLTIDLYVIATIETAPPGTVIATGLLTP